MIQGSIVALVTPMTADGAVDETSLKKLVEFHIEQGSDALVAVGTTGESATLDEDEHCRVIEIVMAAAAGRIPVIAGTGANCTREAIRLTGRARNLGVAGCLLVTPYYNKPTQEGLYLHYRAVAEAVDTPVILYNVPGRTACDMLPETVGRLAKVPGIVGIKEATGKLERLQQIRELTGDDFAIYTGDDASSRQFCLAGGNGSITVTGNVAPRMLRDMLAAAMQGDNVTAERLDAGLAALHQSLFIQSNPIPVKWALAEMGLISKGIRLPLTWLSDDCVDNVRAAMRQAGVL